MSSPMIAGGAGRVHPKKVAKTKESRVPRVAWPLPERP